MASQILITGATGFIGRHLTRDLAAAGHDVRILIRDPQKAPSRRTDHVEMMVGDLRDPASLRRACAGVEIVYHIAGIFRFGLSHRQEIYETNIEGTENLFEAAAAAGVKKIVHLSSASVLNRKGTPSEPWPILDENDFPTAPPMFSPYKYSKWESERRVLNWAERGLPVVITNLSCPIGAEDTVPTPTGQMIRDFIQGRFPCYCQVGLNFVNVSDVCTGMQLAAEKGRVGERYLLTNENMWLKEFLDCLSDQTGLPGPRFCLPQWSVLAMSCFGELFDLLNPRSQSARLCVETALQVRSAQFFNNAKAREELGWKPTPVLFGIQEAVAWFQKDVGFKSTCAPLPVVKSHVR